MNSVYATQMGIDPETPFFIGASDGALANLGVGAMGPGEVAVTIGTSGAIRTVTNRPRTDDKGRTFCYALTDTHWVIGGSTNNGGVLLFLPFLSGERAPYWNANARGMFFGISLQHKREHFIRAVLEGVIMSVFSVGTALRDLAGPAKDIRASGGFARSPVWRQILSDVMGRELLVPESHEASALGAAVLALYGLGEIDSLDRVKDWIRITHRHEPDLNNHTVYLELFYLYERVYRKLESELRNPAEWLFMVFMNIKTYSGK